MDDFWRGVVGAGQDSSSRFLILVILVACRTKALRLI